MKLDLQTIVQIQRGGQTEESILHKKKHQLLNLGGGAFRRKYLAEQLCHLPDEMNPLKKWTVSADKSRKSSKNVGGIVYS